jgi:hypothetical protein
MENVKGFEKNEARDSLVNMLKSENYHFQVSIKFKNQIDYIKNIFSIENTIKGIFALSYTIWHPKFETKVFFDSKIGISIFIRHKIRNS